MCSITGAVSLTPTAEVDPVIYTAMFGKALERGRDAWGIATPTFELRSPTAFDARVHERQIASKIHPNTPWVIGLNRGEPTTEHFNVSPDGLAPHTMRREDGLHVGPWKTVHNGTIANDHEIAREFGIPDHGIDSRVLPYVLDKATYHDPGDVAAVLRTFVRGSYALAAGHSSGTLVLACNYKPIFHAVEQDVLYFASLPHFLPGHGDIRSTIKKMQPYSVMVVDPERQEIRTDGLRDWMANGNRMLKTLVVLSGGLDSTTVLAEQVRFRGSENVAAVHLSYGCHANDRELRAVTQICQELDVDLHLLTTDAFEAIGGSTLLQGSGSDAVSGQAGSEYAHEWVPARNLIMSSLAVGLAETEGYDYIALGNNLEESGAYPDNEQEFIRALNEVLPNAVQEGRRVQFIEPVGNMMKHEIVQRGLEIGAPLHLTYSCYRGEEMHCGRCGPCFMRHNAFRMNNARDPLPYQQEVEFPA